MDSPKIVGFYSIRADQKYEESTSSLRYFTRPSLPLDLNHGIADLKTRPDEYFQTKMEKILTFILNHKEEFVSKLNEGRLIPSTQYITYRAILRLIMLSSSTTWTVIATKYKGNIYLCRYKSQEDIDVEKTYVPQMNSCSIYWLLLKHHCMSAHPKQRPDVSQVSDSNAQFFCVFRRNLCNRKFLFAAQVDGTDSATPLDPKNPSHWRANQFIKMRLNFELTALNRIRWFNDVKIYQMWAQNYLTGVEKVYIAFRNIHGIVKEMRCYSIDELKEISKQQPTISPTGEEFLNSFLQKVEHDLKGIDCPYTTMKYHHDHKTGSMDMFQLSSTKHQGKTEYSILPDWYIQEMNKNK